jgi:4'-phosphopantetheinyl transferase
MTSGLPGRETLPSLPPGSGEVHVWPVWLDRADWRDSLDAGRLSSDELDRARRYPFEREQRRFAVCRATLRVILAAYLGRPPCELRFGYGPHGKPHLEPGHAAGAVRFNVSHSHELALVAVSREQELGIDVERLRPLPELDDIAALAFGAAGREALGRVAPSARLSAFYRHWTLTEAYLKARGSGLAGGTEVVDVTSLWDRPDGLVELSDRGAGGRWAGRALDPAPGYVAALVVEGPGRASVREMSAWPMTPPMPSDEPPAGGPIGATR